MNKVRILITSVGSLVGQNILDALEYYAFLRRDKVTVIGTNSLYENANNFRCDVCYLVPNTSSDSFSSIMTEIIKKEEPDLILSGRDEDTEAMWTLMEARPDLKGKLPYGNLNTILYALDKWQTWKFTKKHKLPFAETIRADQANNPGKMKDFVKNVKFPLIAKPVRGFASKGVFYIRSWKDVETAADFDNYIFQEYLGDPANLKNYFNKMDSLTPLFAHTPNISHFSCHTIISPTGEISPVFISKNEHDSGVTTGFRKIQNSELENLTLNYARAIFAEGGAGPLTVQFRQNREGLWKAQEINLRTNGNTFPRLMFGQDDLGLIMKYFLPEYDFPVYSPKEDMTDDLVCKTLFCNRIDIDSIIGLKENQKWQQNK